MYNRFWGKPEMRELTRVLVPDEKVIGAANGRYKGGFAMLLATDRRLLLIDKKIMFLNIEDIRYDMISQVEYCARIIDATVSVHTVNDTLRFTAWKQNHLRRLTGFMQEKVMELRQMYEQQTSQRQEPLAQVLQARPVAEYQQIAPYARPAVEPPVPNETFAQRVPVPRPYPNAPLTVSRRVSRFYPLAND
jgi:hypothetical protein